MDSKFGLLTPEILAKIIIMAEDKTITRKTGIELIGLYMKCDPSIIERIET